MNLLDFKRFNIFDKKTYFQDIDQVFGDDEDWKARCTLLHIRAECLTQQVHRQKELQDQAKREHQLMTERILANERQVKQRRKRTTRKHDTPEDDSENSSDKVRSRL